MSGEATDDRLPVDEPDPEDEGDDSVHVDVWPPTERDHG